jgi:hypothetical protein
MGLHQCHLKPCPACLQEELDKANSTIADLRSLLRRDAGRQETALQLITATLEALMAESKRLLTSQGEDKPDLPITVPDSPWSKQAAELQALRQRVRRANPYAKPKHHAGTYVDRVTGRIRFAKEDPQALTLDELISGGGVKRPNMTKAQAIEESRERLLKKGVKDPYASPAKVMVGAKEVDLDKVIQEIVDSYVPEVETKGFLTTKGFFKQTKGKSHQPRKSERKSPEPAGKKNAGAPKGKSSTRGRKSKNTSPIPARGSSKFPKHSNKFREYEDNHRNVITPSFFSEGFDDE